MAGELVNDKHYRDAMNAQAAWRDKQIAEAERVGGTAAKFGAQVRHGLGQFKDEAINVVDSYAIRPLQRMLGGMTGAYDDHPQQRQAVVIPAAPTRQTNQQPETNQQTPANTTTRRTVGGVEADVTSDANGRVTQVQYGSPNTPGYGMIRLTGTPNQQAAQRPQPGLGYNQDAAQQAAGWRNLHEPVNQYGGAGGYRNVRDADGNIRPGLFAIRGNAGGYGFQGSEKDAALFAAPVWKPAYQVQNKPNLTFLQYERARRAAPAIDSRPNWDDYKGMTWQTRIKKYQIDMDAWDKQRARAMGYDPEMEKLAMQREQLAQQYGFNMAQAGNDALRAQAALGLNALQLQEQARRNAALDAYFNARTPEDRARAAENLNVLNGAKQERGERDKLYTETDTDPATGATTTRYLERTENGMREVPRAQAGGQEADFAALYANEKAWLEPQQIEFLDKKPKEEREKIKDALFLQLLKNRK